MMQPETSAMARPNDSSETTFLHQLESEIGQRNFDHWFRDKVRLEHDGELLSIGVGSPFLLSWMQKHFRQPVADVAQKVFGATSRVRFQVDARISLHSSPEIAKPVNETRTRVAATPAHFVDGRGRRFADLSDFVKGACNELPFTAAKQVCDSPGAKFNPLFLYGGVGLGKTHLLEGIYRQLRRRYPALHVMFLTSEAFTNYFTEALRQRTLPSFRQRFRNVDAILVDDVDFLNAKRVIQEEFLHTFKQLESHGKQIVVTADRHPRLLSKLSEELTSRFLSGLVCRIEAPDAETRQRIVERRSARMDAVITADALTFVAQRFCNNVRELEGALNCLETYYQMTRKRIGVTVARRILADLERDCIRVIHISDVEQVVCSFFGVSASELKSSRRHRSVSRPRMLAMFLARKLTQAPYSEIGQYFGGRNHSTVMSAQHTVQRWMADGSPIQFASQTWPLNELLETLEQQLQAG